MANHSSWWVWLTGVANHSLWWAWQTGVADRSTWWSVGVVATVRGGCGLWAWQAQFAVGVVWRLSYCIRGPTFSPPSGSRAGRWKGLQRWTGLEAGLRWPGRSSCGNWGSASFLSHSALCSSLRCLSRGSGDCQWGRMSDHRVGRPHFNKGRTQGWAVA